jgi:pyrroloquinoline quinone (PQQ) biosynthesis protein C
VSLDLAALVWKETRPFMLDTGDIREAANHVVEALIRHHSAEEIRDAFKFDGAIKLAVGDYLGEHEEDDLEEDERDELLDQYDEDGEFNYDEY